MNKKNKPTFEKKWQKIFDGTAKNCPKDFEKSTWTKHGAEGHEKYFFIHFNNFILKKNGKILDVGCGPGNYCQTLAKMGFNVYGVDFSKEMIKIAKSRDNENQINYKQSNIYNLPFQNNYFDMLICIGVFQTVQDYKRAFKEIYRVIKPGGNFYLNTLNKNAIKYLLKNLLKKDESKIHKRYSFLQLRKELKKVSFSGIKVKGVYYFYPFLTPLENFLINTRIYKLLDKIFCLSQYITNSLVLICKK